ncbi:MAG: quinolinate synthase [Candidatus Omnitrophota bacterium]|jgi:quinolinate synthase
MVSQLYSTIQEEIQALKTQRDAVILAHNYQSLDVQKVADFVGDSLFLARKAASLKNQVIVFAGVHFMAESVSILSPDKTVLMPDPNAGCSLASMITADEVRDWKSKHPDGLVVCYVNTSAEVKAESDYCCTSSNAVAVVNSLPKDRDVLFIPDFFLGLFAQRKSGRKLHLWPGFCHVHARITSESVAKLKKQYPEAELLMHPECGCLTKSMDLADHILSTGGMVDHVKKNTADEYLIATETGLVDQLQEEHPDKKFHAVGDRATCEYMKMNNLEKIVNSLEHLTTVIKVPEEIASKARISIQRMIEIS